MVLSLLRGRVAEIKTQGKADSKRQTARPDAFVRTDPRGRYFRGATYGTDCRSGCLPFAVYCLLLQLTVSCLLFTVCCFLQQLTVGSRNDYGNHSSSGF